MKGLKSPNPKADLPFVKNVELNRIYEGDNLSFMRSFPEVFIDLIYLDPLQQVNSPSKEKKDIGYPTQKTLALLNRIIKIFTNEGDLVADFFCGCGTTIDSA